LVHFGDASKSGDSSEQDANDDRTHGVVDLVRIREFEEMPVGLLEER
jgi:hypothetical protein